MRRSLSSEISPEDSGSKVRVAGWVAERRDLGGIRFIVLRDREGTLQVTTVKKKASQELFDIVDDLRREDVISVEGTVRAEQKAPNGVEITPEKVDIIARSATPLPLDPTGRVEAELDTRLDSRFIDLRRPATNAIFKIKSAFLSSIRSFFDQRGFVEINTPKVIASATEGGTELFPISYFETEAFLAQSPQLYKEELTASFERVYEIGPVFRAELHDTTRHLNEVLMVDMEEAFATEEDVMKHLEDMTAHSFSEVSKRCTKELSALEVEVPELSTPFKRITYTETLDMLKEKGVNIDWGVDLATSDLKILGDLTSGPYFITDWPDAIKPFYIQPKEDGRESYSFDLMYGGLELSSGGRRVHERALLEERLKKRGLAPESFEYHLRTFDYGMPPHSGWGVGVERVLMAMLGLTNIREAVLYPRDRKRLTP